MKDTICHLRCDTCKSQSIGDTLKECLDKIKCLSDGGPLDDTCYIALKADGKAVFELNQKLKDDYKGETNLSGKIQDSKNEQVKPVPLEKPNIPQDRPSKTKPANFKKPDK